MEKFYTKFNKNTFKILTILFCYTGDFSILLYLYKKFNNLETFRQIIKLHPSLSDQHLGPEMIGPLFEITMQSLVLFLFLAIIVHSAVYILFWYGKKSPTAYIKILSLFGAPACLFLLVSGVQLHLAFLWFAPQAFLYIFVFLGLFYLKKLAR